MYKEYNPLIDNGESVTFKKKYTRKIYSRVHRKHLKRFSVSHAAYTFVVVVVIIVVVMNKLLPHIRILMTLLIYAIQIVGV